MKRIPTEELLDSDSGTPEEIASSLADLRWINRTFGGRATTLAMVEQVAKAMGASQLSLLEVAAGSGDSPRYASQELATRGFDLKITLLDQRPSHVGNGGRSVAGDALALPFQESSFDLVSSGLFAHHLSPEDVVQFVNESLRVSRKAVLINDLIRHPLHLAMVYAGSPFYRSRLTRHDAPASVRQAYTVSEMHEMLRATTASRVEISRHYLFRMGVIAWK
jgi:ubiquinone/menaquinone biosynthesis C-methylase UbiE